jgi:uncharacterized membrane protein
MNLSPILILHIFAGIVGFSSGVGAMLFKKGSPLHRAAGNAFAGSMLFLCAAGAYMATFVHPVPINALAAVLTFYWVSTGWLAARRPEYRRGAIGFLLLLVALGSGLAGLSLGLGAAEDAAPCIIFGSLALLSAALDVRVWVRGLAGGHRIARHLWRMCAAFMVTTNSLFLGNPGNTLLPRFVFHTELALVPPLLLLAAMIFWLIRVLRKRVPGRLSPLEAHL